MIGAVAWLTNSGWRPWQFGVTELTQSILPGVAPMSLSSELVNESSAARRIRLLAPLVALLVLVALTLAPGIIAHLP